MICISDCIIDMLFTFSEGAQIPRLSNREYCFHKDAHAALGGINTTHHAEPQAFLPLTLLELHQVDRHGHGLGSPGQADESARPGHAVGPPLLPVLAGGWGGGDTGGPVDGIAGHRGDDGPALVVRADVGVGLRRSHRGGVHRGHWVGPVLVSPVGVVSDPDNGLHASVQGRKVADVVDSVCRHVCKV